VAFDLGAVAHPSPCAALLSYDAAITRHQGGLSISELLGDGSNAASDRARVRRDDQGIGFHRRCQANALYKTRHQPQLRRMAMVEVCARAVISGGAFRLIASPPAVSRRSRCG
jgi:hypothetical protein